MDQWSVVASALVGAALGAAVGAVVLWLFSSARTKELLSQREEAAQRLAQLEQEVGQQRTALLEAARERARFEERALGVDRLSQELADRDARVADLAETVAAYREAEAKLQTTLEERERALEDQRRTLESAEARLTDTFKALSGDALKESSEELRKTAGQILDHFKTAAEGDLTQRQKAIDELLRPVRERLQVLDDHNQAMERRRQGAYQELLEQVKALNDQQLGLTKETNRLVKALQDPGSAGQWGEMVLERVVEMAGLEEHVAFTTQESHATEQGKQRPDMTVHLPGRRTLVLDSKAPMRSYVEALNTEDGEKQGALLRDHAKKLLEHARDLKRRDYTKTLDTAPDFVVLFVPSEAAFRAALEHRPMLMEEAMECNVVLASPLSLLSLLRLASHSWRQERLAENARQLVKDAQDLYDRIGVVADKYNSLGKNLGLANKAFNEMGRSMETRLLPAARRFKAAGVTSTEDVALIGPLDVAPISLSSPEFQASSLALFEDADVTGQSDD